MLVRTVYFKVACVVSLWFWSKQQPWNNAMYWPCKKWTKSQTIKEVAEGGGGGGGGGVEGRKHLQTNPMILKTLLASERGT